MYQKKTKIKLISNIPKSPFNLTDCLSPVLSIINDICSLWMRMSTRNLEGFVKQLYFFGFKKNEDENDKREWNCKFPSRFFQTQCCCSCVTNLSSTNYLQPCNWRLLLSFFLNFFSLQMQDILMLQNLFRCLLTNDHSCKITNHQWLLTISVYIFLPENQLSMNILTLFVCFSGSTSLNSTLSRSNFEINHEDSLAVAQVHNTDINSLQVRIISFLFLHQTCKFLFQFKDLYLIPWQRFITHI